jgi:hypothetical protein
LRLDLPSFTPTCDRWAQKLRQCGIYDKDIISEVDLWQELEALGGAAAAMMGAKAQIVAQNAGLIAGQTAHRRAAQMKARRCPKLTSC